MYNMSIKINHENMNLYKFGEKINNKIVIINENENSETSQDFDLNQKIFNKYLDFIKVKNMMHEEYFKILLPITYHNVFTKTLTWKNVPDEIDVQINIKKMLGDVSLIQTYEIFKYYNKKNDTFKKENLIDLTALFYSTLYFYIKNEFRI